MTKPVSGEDSVNKRSDRPIADDTLNTVGRGQWVRDRILDAYPELLTNNDDMGKGPKAWADLNRNGFPDESEIFDDFDGDCVVGNIEDFVRYYEQNSEVLEQNIPFFKWVAAMDPHRRSIFNPIHDYLSLAYDVVPASDIKEMYGLLGSVISDVRQFYGASTVKTIVTLLQQKLASEQKGSFLLLGAAYQIGLVEESDGLMSIQHSDGRVKDVTVDELYGDFYAHHARGSDKYGDLERAQSCYEDAIYLDPSYQSRYHYLGAVMYDRKKYEGALGVYDVALKRDPYDAKALSGRGAAYLILKNIRAARADFVDAVRFDSTHGPAHVGLGRIQHLKKNYRGARRHYSDAIKVDPSSALGYYWRAVAYDDQRMSKKAIADFIRAIKRDRSSGEAFHGLALAQYDAGYYDYAYRNLRAAIRRDPSNAVMYKDLGFLQLDRKKPKAALWAFNKALQMKPKFVSAFIGRGSFRHSQNEYLKALADYEKALTVVDATDVRSRADISRNMGFLYLDMGMPKLAYKSFFNVTVYDSKNPRAWCELGEILSKPEYNSKLAKAVGTNVNLAALKAFAKAMKLDKKFVRAYHGTAMVWFRQGKYEKSLENLNKCLDIDRHNADTLYMRSKVHDKLGNYGSASKDRTDAYRIKPSLRERK